MMIAHQYLSQVHTAEKLSDLLRIVQCRQGNFLVRIVVGDRVGVPTVPEGFAQMFVESRKSPEVPMMSAIDDADTPTWLQQSAPVL
ncbi:hypothetical protein SAMN04487974_11455 [Pelagibacterium luteolum]|uniref:Uncharacterized protein n=1 Tax=Pelagibacterium luteolum TaxID=440168 RepID=A0A1G7YKH7_9HYPH|nr:hypothetical protein SAMN04487974_11455 [Pelagibacterium luteolum]